jgi:hypothetical protein
VPFALAGPYTSLWLLGAVLVIRGFGIGAVLIPPLCCDRDAGRPPERALERADGPKEALIPALALPGARERRPV